MAKEKSFKEIKEGTLFDKEENVLDFWKKNNIFQKSLDKNSKKKVFSFYDGPPFITGLPHYATLLPSIAKDIIPRYKTMRGKYVPRIWGWDVHGLPAENKVEQELGFKVKKDIEEFGIDKFIDAAKKYVAKGSQQWEWYIDHIGRWADMSKSYRTDDLQYMETVMWIFKELYEKELIYKGKRVSLYCPRCATPLSKFEVTMDNETYSDVEDPAVTIAFGLKDEKNTSILAWTTTPWTLPANNGLAVNPKIQYISIEKGSQKYILAEKALERYPEFKDWKRKSSFRGKELIGKSFKPLFEPLFDVNPEKDHKVWGADFPTTEEGTGIVHIAPAFGEDDFNLGRDNGISVPLILGEDGKFLDDLPFAWAGVFYKKADPIITDHLREKGLLIKEDRIIHSYPHCYRCNTPLIYMAQEAWYMRIDNLRKELLSTNKKINWVPEHFGNKRFKYNLESAPDWSLSRTRYWGTPIPVWETEDGERIVIGSIKELEKLSGQKITDLHRPFIDEVVITTPSGKKAYRVKEILDVWFESGSMPYAQDHYPFENKEKFEAGFPTDFIIEYTGQLRGWFYYLHVLANALKKSPAFKNVVVTGVLMGTDGTKMSKSKGNYPDPRGTIEQYGAEALRLYFMSNRIMLGEDLSLSERDIKEAYRSINVLHNSYKYFLTYANLHNWKPAKKGSGSKNILDKWVLTRLEEFIDQYSSGLDEFDFPTSTRAIRPFIEDLSTWYIRRARNRFVEGDKEALQTLYTVFDKFSKAVAPTLPFTAETIHRSLSMGKEESVHLCDYPKVNKKKIKDNSSLLKKMELIRAFASAIHTLRAESENPVRQKLAKVVIKNSKGIKTEKDLLELLEEEVNVDKIEFDTNAGKGFVSTKIDDMEISLDTVLTDELRAEGLLRELMRQIQDARKKEGLEVGQKASLKISISDKTLKEVVEKNIDEIKANGHLSEIALSGGTEEILGNMAKIKIVVS